MILNKVDLLFGKPVKLADNITLHVPTVEEVVYTERYGSYTQPFLISTRQMFSSLAEVDELEMKFPSIWQMIFTAEGDQILGQMYGSPSGGDVVIDALAYWTGYEKETFQKLSNKKIINEKADWIIDESVFDNISSIIKTLLGYEEDYDVIAPRNMSERQLDIWKKTYAGRMRSRQKNGRTLADKILILSISMDAYIPLDEIRKMSIYHFNKLYEGLSEKESYQKQWEVKMSPKFESGTGNMKHWKEKFKI